MKTFLYCEAGFVEKDQWLPNSWVNVECPTDDDFKFLREDLKVPTSFLNDIADTDERPRTDTEGNWLLTILRIPVQTPNQKVSYTTVPIGIITNNEIIVSICYHSTEMIPDFIQHICRKSINIPNKYELIFTCRLFFKGLLASFNLVGDIIKRVPPHMIFAKNQFRIIWQAVERSQNMRKRKRIHR